MSVEGTPLPEEQGASSEISYRFCNDCSNLLYPKEEPGLQRLIYYCNTCNTATDSEAACTYRQNLNENAQESMGEKAFVSQDATVGDPEDALCTMCGHLMCSKCGSGKLPHEQRECPKCHETDVVYFQSQQRKGDIGMSLYYVCTNPQCNYAWSKTNESR